MNPGKTIRYLRELRGIQQKDLAASLFITPPTLSLWERNIQNITIGNMKKVLDKLNFELAIKNPDGKIFILNCDRLPNLSILNIDKIYQSVGYSVVIVERKQEQ